MDGAVESYIYVFGRFGVGRIVFLGWFVLAIKVVGVWTRVPVESLKYLEAVALISITRSKLA